LYIANAGSGVRDALYHNDRNGSFSQASAGSLTDNLVYAGLKAADMLKHAEVWPLSAGQVCPFLHPQTKKAPLRVPCVNGGDQP